LLQAESDRLCAQKVWDLRDHRLFCQLIAKYQQMVEKSVKAVLASIKDFGIIGLPNMGYSHDLAKLIDSLSRLPKSHSTQDIQQKVDGLLTHYHRHEIAAISQLAPKRPSTPGELHRLNTEYPFESAAGIWTVPASAEAFSVSQVERFRTLSDYLYGGAKKIVSTLRR
jgi:hypothetical protein